MEKIKRDVSPGRNIRISDELWEDTLRIADEMTLAFGVEVSRSDVIRTAIKKFIAKYREESSGTVGKGSKRG